MMDRHHHENRHVCACLCAFVFTPLPHVCLSISPHPSPPPPPPNCLYQPRFSSLETNCSFPSPQQPYLHVVRGDDAREVGILVLVVKQRAGRGVAELRHLKHGEQGSQLHSSWTALRPYHGHCIYCGQGGCRSTVASLFGNRKMLSKLKRRRAGRQVCLFVGCLTSQQHASVSQRRICSDKFTCCRTEIEVADQTLYLSQSQYTDNGPTSPSADPIYR